MSTVACGRIPGGCGVLNFYQFNVGYQSLSIYTKEYLKKNAPSAGWAIATFRVGYSTDQQVYDELKTMFPIVHQSPVRRNKNSDNDFFFCIYDLEGEVK